MSRRWLLVLLLLAGTAGSYFAFQQHQDVQQVGQEVYQELDGDGYAPLPSILDDPIFQDLPPPPAGKPVSMGRYKPPAEVKAPVVEAVRPPESARETEKPVKAETPPAASEEPATVLAEPEAASQPEAVPVPLDTPEEAPSQTAEADTAVQNPETTSPPVQPQAKPETPEAPVKSAPQNEPPAPPPPAPQTPSSAAPPVEVAPARFLDRIRTKATLHVLVMGNDQPELGTGRADVLLVLSMDPVKRQLTFLSIPRDTRTLIPDFKIEKINAGYAHGGATRQTLTVEHFLGLPMDKYVEISMNGFQRAIDLVGGVTVNPPFEFTIDQYQFKPGQVRLNGEQALAYSRMRKQDPRGDLGRNDRQREIIRSLMRSLAELSPQEFNEMLVKLQRDLRTNFSPSEVVELRQIHDYLLENQVTESVRGVNRKIGGIWYFEVTDRERQRLHLQLR